LSKLKCLAAITEGFGRNCTVFAVTKARIRLHRLTGRSGLFKHGTRTLHAACVAMRRMETDVKKRSRAHDDLALQAKGRIYGK